MQVSTSTWVHQKQICVLCACAHLQKPWGLVRTSWRESGWARLSEAKTLGTEMWLLSPEAAVPCQAGKIVSDAVPRTLPRWKSSNTGWSVSVPTPHPPPAQITVFSLSLSLSLPFVYSHAQAQLSQPNFFLFHSWRERFICTLCQNSQLHWSRFSFFCLFNG